LQGEHDDHLDELETEHQTEIDELKSAHEASLESALGRVDALLEIGPDAQDAQKSLNKDIEEILRNQEQLADELCKLRVDEPAPEPSPEPETSPEPAPTPTPKCLRLSSGSPHRCQHVPTGNQLIRTVPAPSLPPETVARPGTPGSKKRTVLQRLQP